MALLKMAKSFNAMLQDLSTKAHQVVIASNRIISSCHSTHHKSTRLIEKLAVFNWGPRRAPFNTNTHYFIVSNYI